MSEDAASFRKGLRYGNAGPNPGHDKCAGGRHASLLLPAGDGRLVEYALGDWDFMALNRKDAWHTVQALFWSPQSALSRRFVSVSQAPTLERNVHVGPGASLIGPITVGEGSKVRAGAVLRRSVPPGSLVETPAPLVHPRTMRAAS